MLQQQQLVGERCCRLNKPYLKSPEGIIRALLIVIIDNICFSIFTPIILLNIKGRSSDRHNYSLYYGEVSGT